MASLKDLWLEFTVYRCVGIIDVPIPMCGLCANTGIVNTLESAITPNGVNCGMIGFCICPNGRARKKADDKKKKGLKKVHDVG